MEIETRIRGGWKRLTPSEQKLATFLLANLQALPFETAASIGQRVGVSAMTVGRYIRKLGYGDLRDIKHELRGDPPASSWTATPSSKATFTPATLKSKIAGLGEVYRLQEAPEWPRIVGRLVTARRVHVASFEVGRFLGLGFAAMLQALRPGVHFCDGAEGSYADILLDEEPDACLVLIDVRRYSRQFRPLAETAAARSIPTVILTDVYCHWARAVSDDVLMIETDFGIRSLGMAQVLFELLLGAVAAQLPSADERFREIDRLRRLFACAGEAEA
jgi:DNA-binding MurR/RpiR family transcriptional regulator